VAERTGLEPAASGVTGRRYNQLNYRSKAPNLVSVIARRVKDDRRPDGIHDDVGLRGNAARNWNRAGRIVFA
jgi:hypothetical protein